MVSLMRVTSSSPPPLVLGQDGVTKVFSCMMDIGLSFARIPGRSAYSRCSWMPLTKAKKALSCHQVYFSCCNTSGQLERVWWVVCGHRDSWGLLLVSSV